MYMVSVLYTDNQGLYGDIFLYLSCLKSKLNEKNYIYNSFVNASLCVMR